jgi:hypothetical protein
MIPVNKKDHWFTVIIVNLPKLKEMILDYPIKKEYRPEDRPYILMLDPLVNVEENLDLMLRMYLEAELKENLGPSYEINQMTRHDAGESSNGEVLLITEANLPHYQLIVVSLITRYPARRIPSTAEYSRSSTWSRLY